MHTNDAFPTKENERNRLYKNKIDFISQPIARQIPFTNFTKLE